MFRVVVDNQVVARIAHGDKSLRDEAFAVHFERIVSRFYLWMSSRDCVGCAPVDWRPREFNTLADGLANEAMDRKDHVLRRLGSWSSDDLVQFVMLGLSDGGLRRSETGDPLCASCGWTVVAYNPCLQAFHILEEGGSYLPECRSAFAAEVVGLDCLTGAMEWWWSGWGGGSSTHGE